MRTIDRAGARKAGTRFAARSNAPQSDPACQSDGQNAASGPAPVKAPALARASRGAMLGLLGGGLLFALAACQPQMTYHGFAPSDADLAQIQVGRDNRERVAELIGQPGMGGVLEGSDWFYVQSDWRHTHLRAPTETDRQVVAVSFDRNDRVANIERFGQRDGEVVALSRRITDAGTRPSILRQVFRVFGQMGGMVGGLTDPDS